MTEYGHQAACRPQREEKQPQQRGLARARGPGEKLKRMRIDTEGKVAQDLGTKAIAQPYMLKSHHVSVPTGSFPFARESFLCFDHAYSSRKAAEVGRLAPAPVL